MGASCNGVDSGKNTKKYAPASGLEPEPSGRQSSVSTATVTLRDSIITRGAGNTGTFHSPVISPTQISRTLDAISAKTIRALDRAAD